MNGIRLKGMPARIFKNISLISLLFIAACTRAGFFVANLPASFDKNQTVLNVEYDKTSRQTLDIYKPAVPSQKPLPVLVFFYGGRWEDGHKEDYRFVASRFVDAGYVVVIPDYRKYPAVKFPAFVDDGADAIAWVHYNIAAYGGDADRLYLMGHSSGAHIAALLTADEHYLKNRKIDPKIIRAFAGLAGPYDFTPDDADLVDMFGPPAKYPQMQVTTFIDGHEPPMLLLQGVDDTTVKLYNLEKLKARIEQKGGAVKSILYTGIDHVGIAAALSWVKKGDAPVVQDVLTFFKAHP